MGEIILWTIAGLVGLHLLLGLFITFAGLRHSKHHVVARSIKMKQSPEAIWAVITDHANEPTWQSHLEVSKPLPDDDGKPVWQIRHKRPGSPPIKLTTLESIPPKKLVRRIDDAKQVYSGRWEYVLTPEYGCTKLTITEHSEIPNPFYRGMFHLFGGPAMYVILYEKALAEKFGEPAEIIDPKTDGQ